MAIQRSQGKARPQLPRGRDLPAIGAVVDRPSKRDTHGRFAAGNIGGRGRGWKRAIAKMLGRDVADDLADVATAVAEDAWRLFSVAIRELPSDGANVRALVARKARHEALEGYWTARALAKLGTPEGDDAEAKATAHGVRAERLTVTAIDVATRLANASPPAIDLTAARRRLLDAPQVDDEPAPVEPTELSREDGSPPADVAPGEGDDSWIDAPAVEPSEPVHEAPEAAPMVREPMTREQVDAGLMARVLTPAKTGGHLCVHKLNPSTCLDCFRSVQAQAPHCRPWRELLPPGHPQRRPPR